MGEKKINTRQEPLIDDNAVADLIGMSVPFVIKARREYGLPYYKFGRSVRYKPSEVIDWVKERRVID